MRFLPQLFFILFSFALLQTADAQIIYYSNATSGSLSSVAANASGTSLTRVNGATTPSSSCSTGFSSTNFPSTSVFSTTLPAIETSATAADGYSLNVTSFSVDLRRSGTGPANTRMAYSTDGGTTWINQGSNKSPKNASCGTTSTYTWTKSITVNAPSKLQFRVYGFKASSTTGTLQILNLKINGTVVSTGCPIPVSLSSSNITSSSATLNWGAVSGALSYNIQYRQSGSLTWITVSSTTNSLTVSGLNAATSYEFQIQTVCTVDTSNYSVISLFNTLALNNTVCDSTLWNHVYNSYRLIVNNQCTSVTGVVKNLIYEADGDIHIRLNVDSAFKYMINSYNISGQYGDLVCEPVCATSVTQENAKAACLNFTNTVYIPNVGEYVEVIGSYVTDNNHGWNEIHPVTSIAIISKRLLDENENSSMISKVTVIPNPSTTFINFGLNEIPSTPVFINIVDESGRNAGQYQIFDSKDLRITTKYLPSGIYYYSVRQHKENVATGSFIVAH